MIRNKLCQKCRTRVRFDSSRSTQRFLGGTLVMMQGICSKCLIKGHESEAISVPLDEVEIYRWRVGEKVILMTAVARNICFAAYADPSWDGPITAIQERVNGPFSAEEFAKEARSHGLEPINPAEIGRNLRN